MASNLRTYLYFAALFVLLAGGLVLSQGAPIAWQSASTTATNEGAPFTARNILTVTLADPVSIVISIPLCPEGWTCIPTPATLDHPGGAEPASYEPGALILAPENASGTVSVSATDNMSNSAGEWLISVAPPAPPAEDEPPPAEEPPPEGAPSEPVQMSGCGAISGSAFLSGDIDAGAFEECLVITGPNAALDCMGHEIRGGGIALRIDNAPAASIRNCRISGANTGLTVSVSPDVSISDSSFSTLSYPIIVGDSPGFSISGTHAGSTEPSTPALTLANSPLSSVSNCEFTALGDSAVNLYARSDDTVIDSSTITSLGIYDSSRVAVRGSSITGDSTAPEGPLQSVVHVQEVEGRAEGIEISGTTLGGMVSLSVNGIDVQQAVGAGQRFMLRALASGAGEITQEAG